MSATDNTSYDTFRTEPDVLPQDGDDVEVTDWGCNGVQHVKAFYAATVRDGQTTGGRTEDYEVVGPCDESCREGLAQNPEGHGFIYEE